MENANWKEKYEILLKKLEVIEANLEEHRLLSTKLNRFYMKSDRIDNGIHKQESGCKTLNNQEEIKSSNERNIPPEVENNKKNENTKIVKQFNEAIQHESKTISDNQINTKLNKTVHEESELYSNIKLREREFLNVCNKLNDEFNSFRTQFLQHYNIYENINEILIQERDRNFIQSREINKLTAACSLLQKRCSRLEQERDTVQAALQRSEIENQKSSTAVRLMKRMQSDFEAISKKFEDIHQVKSKLEEKSQHVLLLERLLDKKNDEVKTKDSLIFALQNQSAKTTVEKQSMVSFKSNLNEYENQSNALDRLQAELKKCQLNRVKWKSLHLKQVEINKILKEKLEKKSLTIKELEKEVQEMNKLRIRLGEMQMHLGNHNKL
ncbi:hypothetical protein HK103_001658 [Boothiomyces macroporosus]|uniref:Uncharacterized protein n=1 Tax=Boothiomyces macroporosus TaxID=261099 RepID=A0AAD5UDQ7_9FUNG|nr:hypothetical protein HK103_001658 [Boothiomyces macroporosus]